MMRVDEGSGSVQDRNKSIVLMLTRELFNDAGDPNAVYELVAEDFVDHTPAPGSTGDRESYRQRSLAMRASFSDIRTVSEQLLAEGDAVAEHWVSRFRHTGDFLGRAPSGREITIRGMAFYRLRDARIVEFWGISDVAGLMEQLGVSGA